MNKDDVALTASIHACACHVIMLATANQCLGQFLAHEAFADPSSQVGVVLAASACQEVLVKSNMPHAKRDLPCTT